MGINIKVEHFAIEKIPSDADIIVTHKNLHERAQMATKGKKPIVTIENYLQDPNIDALIEQIKQQYGK